MIPQYIQNKISQKFAVGFLCFGSFWHVEVYHVSLIYFLMFQTNVECRGNELVDLPGDRPGTRIP